MFCNCYAKRTQQIEKKHFIQWYNKQRYFKNAHYFFDAITLLSTWNSNWHVAKTGTNKANERRWNFSMTFSQTIERTRHRSSLRHSQVVGVAPSFQKTIVNYGDAWMTCDIQSLYYSEHRNHTSQSFKLSRFGEKSMKIGYCLVYLAVTWAGAAINFF